MQLLTVRTATRHHLRVTDVTVNEGLERVLLSLLEIVFNLLSTHTNLTTHGILGLNQLENHGSSASPTRGFTSSIVIPLAMDYTPRHRQNTLHGVHTLAKEK